MQINKPWSLCDRSFCLIGREQIQSQEMLSHCAKNSHITKCANEIVNSIGFQRKCRVERLKIILGRWAETKEQSFKVNQYEWTIEEKLVCTWLLSDRKHIRLAKLEISYLEAEGSREVSQIVWAMSDIFYLVQNE